MKNIGFIGLGIMGCPMAKNLLKEGYSLTVYDIVPEKVDDLVDAGAKAGSSSKDVAEKSEIIITMLPNSPEVKEAVLGNNGVLDGAKPGTILIDMSSIAPLASKEVAERAKEKKVVMLDAPVSGGPIVAQLGALAIMVGGDSLLFDRVRPVLEAMGRSISHVGPLGTGLAVKLVNNMIAISVVPVVAQALRVGLEQGLELSTMVRVIKASSGNTWITDQWEQARTLLTFLLRDPTQIDSLVTTGLKDLELAAALCDDSGVDSRFVQHAMLGLEQQDAETLRATLGRTGCLTWVFAWGCRSWSSNWRAMWWATTNQIPPSLTLPRNTRSLI